MPCAVSPTCCPASVPDFVTLECLVLSTSSTSLLVSRWNFAINKCSHQRSCLTLAYLIPHANSCSLFAQFCSLSSSYRLKTINCNTHRTHQTLICRQKTNVCYMLLQTPKCIYIKTKRRKTYYCHIWACSFLHVF